MHGRLAKPFFAESLPRVLAHRGLALEAPENTLLAFAHAVALGVTHIETDVTASREGVAVVAHDVELARVAGRPGFVRDLSMRELREIDLGFDQGFCSLEDALDAFPDAFFNIDVKSADAVAPTVEAIERTGAINRVLIASFNERRRLATVRRLPGVATSASARSLALALVAGTLRFSPGVRGALAHVDAVQVPPSWRSVPIASERMVRAFHAAGVEVHVWTINDPADMASLLDIGVDGIVTDRADLALEVIRSRGK